MRHLNRSIEQVGERAGRIGEELGAAAVKLVEETQGRLPEADSRSIGLGPAAAAPAAACGRRPEDATAHLMSLDQFIQQPPQPPPVSRPNLWEEYEQLQARLAEEREMRRGRSLALTAIDEAIRGMASDLLDERRLLAEAEDSRTVHGSRLDSVEVTLEALQDGHGRLQSYQASLEPEHRRLLDAASARARKERQASREGAWAREGPETEALLIAKMELAETLSKRDEVNLRSRNEQAQLTREIEAAREENTLLRIRREEDAKPKGWRALLKPRRAAA